MSTATNIINTLLTAVSGVTGLESYNHIPDLDNLDRNNIQILKNGYGVAAGPMVNLQILMGSRLYIRRTFFVTITNEVYSLENNAASKALGLIGLVDVMDDVAIALHQYSLDNTDVVNCLTVIDDSGPQEIFEDKDNYIGCVLTIEVDYKKE